jgi:signal transduction histidine kinase/ligand-binding sensor domain-containing protein/DNA-binding response OmpR family regulator
LEKNRVIRSHRTSRQLSGRGGPWLAAVGLVALLAALLPESIGVPSTHADYSVQAWGIGQGLPDDSVTAVAQTPDNYLWVGTAGGLSRFDGLRFVTFQSANTPALVNHSVRCLLTDRTGALWIGTEAGLVRYARGIFTATPVAQCAIVDLCEDAAGDVWVATDDRRLLRYHGGKFEAMGADPALPRTEVRTLFADAQGRVWIGFARGSGLVRYEAGRFEPVDTGGVLHNEVIAMAESPRGTIWLGTADGLIRWRDGRCTLYRKENGLAGRRVASLCADADGSLWIGTTALQRISGGEIGTLESALPTPARNFGSMYRDRERNLWVGTDGEGLLRVREPQFRALTLGSRNNSTGIRTVVEDTTGTLWLAEGALGVAKITASGVATMLPPYSDESADEILAAFARRNGEVWLGSRQTLEIIRAGQAEFHPEQGGARAVFEDRQGTVWLGFQNEGIRRWQHGTFAPFPLPAGLEQCTPQSFAQTANGDLYVGTWRHGLLKISGQEVKVFNRAGGQPTDELRCAYVDRADHVWVGTHGRGLALLDRGQLVFPSWASELFDQYIISLIEDDAGNLWLCTPRGILMTSRAELQAAFQGEIPPSQLKVVNVMEGRNYGIADMSCFPNVWKTRTGAIWFATKKMAIVVDPSAVRPIPAPTVHIERVLANGQSLPLTGGLDLPAGTRELVIEYTALNFVEPARVSFQYRLEGHDRRWVPGDRRFALYTNLAPGSYRFQVIAANADGVWSEPGASLSFVLHGHIYETWWAYCLMVLSVGGGIYGVHRWRLAALNREKLRLEKGITERTRELSTAKELAEAATRARTEFLENISHEIRNPLNGIIGLVAMLRETANGSPEGELARSLGACAKALARSFDAVLSFTKLEHGQVTVSEKPFVLSQLVDEVVAIFRATAQQRGNEIVVHREAGAPDRFIGDEEKIGSILGNFISNALKHAPGTPVEISVQCDSVNDYGANITLIVADHGPGISPEEQEQVFQKFMRGSRAKQRRTPGTGLGLATCRALAELLGGHVAVESEPGHGATFFVTLRLKRDREPAPVAAPPAAPRTVTSERALIVEDQPYNQLVVRRLAERLGFTAEVAPTAESALARLAQQTYAVALLDWELPDMRGDELARRIRTQPGGRDTILIATTAHDSEEVRQQCAASGMDGFALKPFELATIARLVDAAYARRSQEGPKNGVRLDLRVFSLVGCNDPEQAEQAAALYLDTLEQELESLKSALDRGDPGAVAKVAHRLKAHAGLIDATELRDLAERLRHEAVGAAPAALAGLHEALVRQAALLRERLTTWRHPPAAV